MSSIIALITVELEIFYKGNSLIKFGRVGSFNSTYCTAEEVASYSVQLPTERTKAQEPGKTIYKNLQSVRFQGCFHPVVSQHSP